MITIEHTLNPGIILEDHKVYMLCEYCWSMIEFYGKPPTVCGYCWSDLFPDIENILDSQRTRLEYHYYGGDGVHGKQRANSLMDCSPMDREGLF